MQALSIDPRAYRFIRAQAMKTVADGLVELVTNCVDAYRKSSHTMYHIDVVSNWASTDRLTSITVRDYALGMDSARMKTCFLQVGAFTNEVGSRGFFSRGAKDICALGNVSFHSIKDDKYSKAILTNDAMGAIEVADVPATQTHRATTGLPNGTNGVAVSIEIDEQYASITMHRFLSDLVSHFALRDIFSASHITVSYAAIENGIQRHFQRLQWASPPSERILITEFAIEGYPDATGTLELFKTQTPMMRDIKQCGFLVRSSESVFCHTWLDMDIWADPMVEYVYGHIKCDYIKDLMYSFDSNGATKENPFLILDHSRGGLIDSHPFAKALYKYPILKVKEALADLDESGSCKRLTMDDLDELLDQFDAFKKEKEVDVAAKPTNQQGWRDARATKLFEEIQQMKPLVVHESQEPTPVVTKSRRKVSSFNLVFRKLDARIKRRYEVKDTAGTVELVINLNNPTLAKHLDGVNDIKEIQGPEGLVMLAEIFIEAFASLLANREIASNDHVKTLAPTDLLKYAESITQSYKVQLDVPIYKLFDRHISAQRCFCKP